MIWVVIYISAMLATAAVMISWVFRTTDITLAWKLVGPIVFITLAIMAPPILDEMLGYPTLQALPDEVTLVAFVAHDDAGTVDLWTMPGPRAYEAPLTPGLKAALRTFQSGMRLKHEKSKAELGSGGGGTAGVEIYHLDPATVLPPKGLDQ